MNASVRTSSIVSRDLPPAARPGRAVACTAVASRVRLPRWLSLNGYVTQAGAVSRGGTMSGVPSGATVDYRRIALLRRAELSLDDRVVVQIGRDALPFGIYNETRYVGTLMPFYQAPTSVYREKEFSTGSADRALISHGLSLPAGFGAELTAYVGQMSYVEASSLPWNPMAPGAGTTPPTSGWV